AFNVRVLLCNYYENLSKTYLYCEMTEICYT
ncbi:hypothetical protein A5876_002233, partial [Enterococcus sp. 3C8_DIV0646]